MLILAVAVSLSAILLFPRIGTELVPEDDQSEFNVSVNLPRGTTLDRTAEFVKDIEPMLLATDNVQTVFTNIQPNQGNYLVGLTPIEERDVSQQPCSGEVTVSVAFLRPPASAGNGTRASARTRAASAKRVAWIGRIRAPLKGFGVTTPVAPIFTMAAERLEEKSAE